MNVKICTAEGCAKASVARGLCDNHWHIWRRRQTDFKPKTRSVPSDRLPFYAADENCWLVPLSRGKFARIDEQDVALVSAYTWCTSLSKITAYAVTKIGGRKNLVTILLHRLITGAAADMAVDHINHDGLDNRRANLRVVSLQENNTNTTLMRTNQSGYKGVSRHVCGKYRASLQIKRKHIHLGLFDTAESAARAYDAEIARTGIITQTNASLGLL